MRARPSYRQLNKFEKEIIDTLLEKDFPGRDEIRRQIDNSLVRPIVCDCGCLSVEFDAKSDMLVKTKERVPVEATYYRNDRPYQILLHVLDGKIKELEFVSYSDIVDSEYPKSNDLKIKINEVLS